MVILIHGLLGMPGGLFVCFIPWISGRIIDAISVKLHLPGTDPNPDSKVKDQNSDENKKIHHWVSSPPYFLCSLNVNYFKCFGVGQHLIMIESLSYKWNNIPIPYSSGGMSYPYAIT